MRKEFLLSGKTPQGREAVEQVDAESPIEAQKILEARGWTELRELSTDDIDDDSSASPAESPQFQQRTVPGFWSGWFAEFRRSPAYFIILVILLNIGIRQRRTQLERTSPGSDIWIYWVAFMLALGLFWYPVLYWVRHWKRRIEQKESASIGLQRDETKGTKTEK
jgi:hypothetical protein